MIILRLTFILSVVLEWTLVRGQTYPTDLGNGEPYCEGTANLDSDIASAQSGGATMWDGRTHIVNAGLDSNDFRFDGMQICTDLETSANYIAGLRWSMVSNWTSENYTFMNPVTECLGVCTYCASSPSAPSVELGGYEVTGFNTGWDLDTNGVTRLMKLEMVYDTWDSTGSTYVVWESSVSTQVSSESATFTSPFFAFIVATDSSLGIMGLKFATNSCPFSFANTLYYTSEAMYMTSRTGTKTLTGSLTTYAPQQVYIVSWTGFSWDDLNSVIGPYSLSVTDAASSSTPAWISISGLDITIDFSQTPSSTTDYFLYHRLEFPGWFTKQWVQFISFFELDTTIREVGDQTCFVYAQKYQQPSAPIDSSVSTTVTTVPSEIFEYVTRGGYLNYIDCYVLDSDSYSVAGVTFHMYESNLEDSPVTLTYGTTDTSISTPYSSEYIFSNYGEYNDKLYFQFAQPATSTDKRLIDILWSNDNFAASTATSICTSQGTISVDVTDSDILTYSQQDDGLFVGLETQFTSTNTMIQMVVVTSLCQTYTGSQVSVSQYSNSAVSSPVGTDWGENIGNYSVLNGQSTSTSDIFTRTTTSMPSVMMDMEGNPVMQESSFLFHDYQGYTDSYGSKIIVYNSLQVSSASTSLTWFTFGADQTSNIGLSLNQDLLGNYHIYLVPRLSNSFVTYNPEGDRYINVEYGADCTLSSTTVESATLYIGYTSAYYSNPTFSCNLPSSGYYAVTYLLQFYQTSEGIMTSEQTGTINEYNDDTYDVTVTDSTKVGQTLYIVKRVDVYRIDSFQDLIVDQTFDPITTLTLSDTSCADTNLTFPDNSFADYTFSNAPYNQTSETYQQSFTLPLDDFSSSQGSTALCGDTQFEITVQIQDETTGDDYNITADTYPILTFDQTSRQGTIQVGYDGNFWASNITFSRQVVVFVNASVDNYYGSTGANFTINFDNYCLDSSTRGRIDSYSDAQTFTVGDTMALSSVSFYQEYFTSQTDPFTECTPISTEVTSTNSTPTNNTSWITNSMVALDYDQSIISYQQSLFWYDMVGYYQLNANARFTNFPSIDDDLTTNYLELTVQDGCKVQSDMSLLISVIAQTFQDTQTSATISFSFDSVYGTDQDTINTCDGFTFYFLQKSTDGGVTYTDCTDCTGGAYVPAASNYYDTLSWFDYSTWITNDIDVNCPGAEGIFSSYDTNSDGYWDVNELATVMSDQGISGTAQEVIVKYDKTVDRKLDLYEIIQYLCPHTISQWVADPTYDNSTALASISSTAGCQDILDNTFYYMAGEDDSGFVDIFGFKELVRQYQNYYYDTTYEFGICDKNQDGYIQFVDCWETICGTNSFTYETGTTISDYTLGFDASSWGLGTYDLKLVLYYYNQTRQLYYDQSQAFQVTVQHKCETTVISIANQIADQTLYIAQSTPWTSTLTYSDSISDTDGAGACGNYQVTLQVRSYGTSDAYATVSWFTWDTSDASNPLLTVDLTDTTRINTQWDSRVQVSLVDYTGVSPAEESFAIVFNDACQINTIEWPSNAADLWTYGANFTINSAPWNFPYDITDYQETYHSTNDYCGPKVVTMTISQLEGSSTWDTSVSFSYDDSTSRMIQTTATLESQVGTYHVNIVAYFADYPQISDNQWIRIAVLSECTSASIYVNTYMADRTIYVGSGTPVTQAQSYDDSVSYSYSSPGYCGQYVVETWAQDPSTLQNMTAGWMWYDTNDTSNPMIVWQADNEWSLVGYAVPSYLTIAMADYNVMYTQAYYVTMEDICSTTSLVMPTNLTTQDLTQVIGCCFTDGDYAPISDTLSDSNSECNYCGDYVVSINTVTKDGVSYTGSSSLFYYEAGSCGSGAIKSYITDNADAATYTIDMVVSMNDFSTITSTQTMTVVAEVDTCTNRDITMTDGATYDLFINQGTQQLVLDYTVPDGCTYMQWIYMYGIEPDGDNLNTAYGYNSGSPPPWLTLTDQINVDADNSELTLGVYTMSMDYTLDTESSTQTYLLYFNFTYSCAASTVEGVNVPNTTPTSTIPSTASDYSTTNVTYESYSGQQVSNFTYIMDTSSTSQGEDYYCGLPNFWLEADTSNGTQSIPSFMTWDWSESTTDGSYITMTLDSTNLADVGLYYFLITTSLYDYSVATKYQYITLNVTSPCETATIVISQPKNDECTIGLDSAYQQIDAYDTFSYAQNTPRMCGDIYMDQVKGTENMEVYSAFNLNQVAVDGEFKLDLTLTANETKYEGTYDLQIQGFLVEWPNAQAQATYPWSVQLFDPCWYAKFNDISVDLMIAEALSYNSYQNVSYNSDNVTDAVGTDWFCGYASWDVSVGLLFRQNFTWLEEQVQGNGPQADNEIIEVQSITAYDQTSVLVGLGSDSIDDANNYVATLTISYPSYKVSISRDFEVTIRNPCFGTSMNEIDPSTLVYMNTTVSGEAQAQQFEYKGDSISLRYQGDITESYYTCGYPTITVEVRRFSEQSFLTLNNLTDDKTPFPQLYQLELYSDSEDDVGNWTALVTVSLDEWSLSKTYKFDFEMAALDNGEVGFSDLESLENEAPYFSGVESSFLPDEEVFRGVPKTIDLPPVEDDDSDVSSTLTVEIKGCSTELDPFIRYKKGDASSGDHAILVALPESFAPDINNTCIQITLDDSNENSFSSFYTQQLAIDPGSADEAADDGNSTDDSNGTNDSNSTNTTAPASDDESVELVDGAPADNSTNSTDSSSAEDSAPIIEEEPYVAPEPEEDLMDSQTYNEDAVDDVETVGQTINKQQSDGDVLGELANLAPPKAPLQISPGLTVEVTPCLPNVNAMTSKGVMKVTMSKDIEELSPNDIRSIEDSNIVQMQVVPNSPGSENAAKSGGLDFKWWVQEVYPNGIGIQIEFVQPREVSGTTPDADQMRVIFNNASRFLKCKPSVETEVGADGQPQVRRLSRKDHRSAEWNEKRKGRKKVDPGPRKNPRKLQATGAENTDTDIPNNFQIVAKMPPQVPLNETETIEESKAEISATGKTASGGAMALSLVFSYSMNNLLGAISSLQMIVHLPLNNVLFTTQLYTLFDILLPIVTFDLFSPFDNDLIPIDWGFSETDPYNENFEWIGYDSSNFFCNLGSIALYLFILLCHTIVNPMLTFAMWRGYEKVCCRFVEKHKKSRQFLINAWIAMWLECYFELMVAGIAGLKMLTIDATELNYSDTVAFNVAAFHVPFVLLFPLFLTWFALVKIRYMISIKQRDKWIELAEMPLCNKELVQKQAGFRLAMRDAFRYRIAKTWKQLLIDRKWKVTDEDLLMIRKLELTVQYKPLNKEFTRVYLKHDLKLDHNPDDMDYPLVTNDQTKKQADYEERQLSRYEKFEILWDGLDLSKSGAEMQPLFYIWRRVIFIWLAFFYVKYPILQIMTYVLLSQYKTYFIAHTWPYEDPVENKNEMFNETMITMIGYCQLVLLGFIDTSWSKLFVGDAMIFFIVFNIGVHVMIMLVEMIIGFFESLKEKWHECMEERAKKREEALEAKKKRSRNASNSSEEDDSSRLSSNSSRRARKKARKAKVMTSNSNQESSPMAPRETDPADLLVDQAKTPRIQKIPAEEYEYEVQNNGQHLLSFQMDILDTPTPGDVETPNDQAMFEIQNEDDQAVLLMQPIVADAQEQLGTNDNDDAGRDLDDFLFDQDLREADEDTNLLGGAGDTQKSRQTFVQRKQLLKGVRIVDEQPYKGEPVEILNSQTSPRQQQKLQYQPEPAVQAIAKEQPAVVWEQPINLLATPPRAQEERVLSEPSRSQANYEAKSRVSAADVNLIQNYSDDNLSSNLSQIIYEQALKQDAILKPEEELKYNEILGYHQGIEQEPLEIDNSQDKMFKTIQFEKRKDNALIVEDMQPKSYKKDKADRVPGRAKKQNLVASQKAGDDNFDSVSQAEPSRAATREMRYSARVRAMLGPMGSSSSENDEEKQKNKPKNQKKQEIELQKRPSVGEKRMPIQEHQPGVVANQIDSNSHVNAGIDPISGQNNAKQNQQHAHKRRKKDAKKVKYEPEPEDKNSKNSKKTNELKPNIRVSLSSSDDDFLKN